MPNYDLAFWLHISSRNHWWKTVGFLPVLSIRTASLSGTLHSGPCVNIHNLSCFSFYLWSPFSCLLQTAIFFFFTPYTPLHCLKSLLRVPDPHVPKTESCSWSNFSLVSSLSTQSMSQGLLAQPVLPVGGSPCLAYPFNKLPFFMSWALTFTVVLHSHFLFTPWWVFIPPTLRYF